MQIAGDWGVKMGSLSESMNPCIGAARPCEIRGMAQYRCKRFLNERLNRLPCGLHLPASIMGPIIGKGEFIPKHKETQKSILFLGLSDSLDLSQVFVDQFGHFKHVD